MDKIYDVCVIGGGISGLSAAALAAKSGLKVCLLEQSHETGGACGAFKRKGALFDKGVAMMYGFGKSGYNAHRFLFNCLNEEIHVIKHKNLYSMNYSGHTIVFYDDINEFIMGLAKIFPDEKENLLHFYNDMGKIYKHVISETPTYNTPDTMNYKEAILGFIRHPVSYLKFLSYINMSALDLINKYSFGEKIIAFFDKLSSTYCYASIKDISAAMMAIMFIENHSGGSYYPVGSTMQFIGKLEKAAEENGCDIIVNTKALKIIPDNDIIEIDTNKGIYYSSYVIYSGTIWNFYDKFLPADCVDKEKREWAKSQKASYSGIVYYAIVKKDALNGIEDAVLMLTSDDKIDESEITLYIMSVDDNSLCNKDFHTLVAIGPSFIEWAERGTDKYEEQKEAEILRIEKRINAVIPQFKNNILYREIASPRTIEYYTMKNWGAVAGPVQTMEQNMLHRQSIKTDIKNLFCCGESTTLGTGTPAVTVSAIAAVNEILKAEKKKLYVHRKNANNYVKIVKNPVQKNWQYNYYEKAMADIMIKANKCNFCMEPLCQNKKYIDIPYIMKKTACGNFYGAKKLLMQSAIKIDENIFIEMQNNCCQNKSKIKVELYYILKYLYEF